MFENLLRIACGEIVFNTPCSREDDDLATEAKIITATNPHVITREVAISSNSYEDPELRVLAETYGELVDGMSIEVPLQELLDLIPRTRRRSDAYRALRSKLARLGVSLNIITTKKTKML